MFWRDVSFLLFLATFKFMFSPATGVILGFNFFEIWIICVLGATLSSATFYFASDFLMERTHKKKINLKQKAIEQGLEFIEKKKFTKTNKFIVRLKNKLGLYGICFVVPLILSIPIGSIIVAKFYGQFKKTFFLVFLGIVFNACWLTALAYIFKK